MWFANTLCSTWLRNFEVMLAGSTWGVSGLHRYYRSKKFRFCQLSRCTNLCTEMVRAGISPQCDVWLSSWAASCLCSVSSHLFNVWAEHSAASGANHCYASTLVRWIPLLKGSEYCGSGSNRCPFPQWTSILTLENGIPAPFLQIRALAHKLTCYYSVAGVEIWEWSCLV